MKAPHIYDAAPITDESVMTIADVRNMLVAYALEQEEQGKHDIAHAADQFAAFMDAYIEKERHRLGVEQADIQAVRAQGETVSLRILLAEWIIALGLAILPRSVRRVHAAALLSHYLRGADEPEVDEWLEEVRALLRGDATVPR